MNQSKAQAQFRSRLASQMKRADMKRATLSALTGANVGQINRWLDGSLMPTYRQFQRVLEIFALEDEYFLGNSASEHSYTSRFK